MRRFSTLALLWLAAAALLAVFTTGIDATPAIAPLSLEERSGSHPLTVKERKARAGPVKRRLDSTSKAKASRYCKAWLGSHVDGYEAARTTRTVTVVLPRTTITTTPLTTVTSTTIRTIPTTTTIVTIARRGNSKSSLASLSTKYDDDVITDACLLFLYHSLSHPKHPNHPNVAVTTTTIARSAKTVTAPTSTITTITTTCTTQTITTTSFCSVNPNAPAQTNFITNGGFETDAAWFFDEPVFPPLFFTSDASKARSGQRLLFATENQVSGNNYVSLFQFVSGLQENRCYNVNFFQRIDSRVGTLNKCYVQTTLADSSFNLGSPEAIIVQNKQYISQVDTAYQQISLPFTLLRATQTAYFQFVFRCDPSDAKISISVDDVSIVPV